MKKTFRRLVSLALALAMALSLAVSASAAELTLDHLVNYGISPVTVSASSITLSNETTNVMNYGDSKTYICTAPVSVSNNGNPYCGIAKLIENNNPFIPQLWEEGQGLSGDGTPVILTNPGKYILTAESVNYPAKLYVVIQVVEGPAEPVTPGLHNFKKVNTYKVGQYSDVPATHTFSENAKAGYEFGIMQGYGTSFGVSSNITRLASIIIACRLNSYYYNGSDIISKVYSGSTQEKHLAYAKDHGILCNFDDVSKPATRSEFAAILSSAFPDEALSAINTVVDNAIPDVTVDMPYADDIYRLYRAGILNGSDALGTFYPTSNINRGAACAIATRMCAEALRKNVTLDKEYAALVEEAVNATLDSYTLALTSLRDSLLAATEGLNSGNSKKLNAAYLLWVDALKEFDNAITLCGNYPELREVKSVISKIADNLTVADPSSTAYSSLTFWQTLAAAVNKSSPLLDKCSALFGELIVG